MDPTRSFDNYKIVLSKGYYESYYNNIYNMIDFIRRSDYSKMIAYSLTDVLKVDLEDAFGKNSRINRLMITSIPYSFSIFDKRNRTDNFIIYADNYNTVKKIYDTSSHLKICGIYEDYEVTILGFIPFEFNDPKFIREHQSFFFNVIHNIVSTYQSYYLSMYGLTANMSNVLKNNLFYIELIVLCRYIYNFGLDKIRDAINKSLGIDISISKERFDKSWKNKYRMNNWIEGIIDTNANDDIMNIIADNLKA